MASINETTIDSHQFPRRRFTHLQPLSPRETSSIERHFEQYLIDHHRYSKLPSISKQSNRQSIESLFMNKKNFLFDYEQQIPTEFKPNTNSINLLLNSEQYRRAHKRLIEYRQLSKIPGIALTTTTNSDDISPRQLNENNELILPLKEALIDTTKAKQYQQQDELDLVDDDSVFSNQTDRRRRAKHWIKDHQFFFTEYQ